MAADSRGPTNGGGAGGGGARGGDGEPQSKGNGEDPEVLGGADGAGDQRGGVALAPAPAPRRSSALSLHAAMARRSWRAPALRQRWARASTPRSGETVGWALGPEWHWRDSPGNRRGTEIRFSPMSTPQWR